MEAVAPSLTEQALLQRNRELLALNKVAETLALCPNQDESLDTVLSRLLEVTAIEAGAIYLAGEAGTLEMAVHQGLSPQFVTATRTIRRGQGLTGMAAATGKVLVIPSVDDCRLRPERRALLEREGIVSFVCVPLKARERVVGAFSLATHAPRTFTEQDVQLLSAIGHQVGVAVENHRLHLQALELERERVRMLEERHNLIQRTQEEERRRIARDLHDAVAQSLAMAVVDAELLKGRLAGREGKDDLDAIQGRLREALNAIRRVLFDLRTATIGRRGLVAALERDLLPRFRRDAGVRADLTVDGWPEELPEEVAFNIYRTIQECLNNAFKHARATRVTVHLRRAEGTLMAVVTDDGRGFDPSRVDESTGFGLTGMRERAALLGGSLTLHTEPGRGTQVTLTLPFPRGLPRRR